MIPRFRIWFPAVLLLCLAVVATVRLAAHCMPIRAPEIRFGARYFNDRHGAPLGVILSQDQEHAVQTTLEQVSPYFYTAILAAEDRRFYEHGGVDWASVIRAVSQRVRGKPGGGASTITLQLARMLHPRPRTIHAKLKEVVLAWRLEAGMTKSEILEAYMNRLPMGGNLYGVEAAARHYFGINAARLDLPQATLLAAIPNNPNQLRPDSGWKHLQQRQSHILRAMVATHRITAGQQEMAALSHVELRTPDQIDLAHHLLFRLALTVPRADERVTVTIDSALQRFAEEQARKSLAPLRAKNVLHAAILVVENRTGEVLAYVGSPSFYGPLGMNDGVLARRQPGSTLKPFLYALAIEQKKIHPGSIMADVPSHWDLGAQAGQYAPRDYSGEFLGPVRASFALANSLNVPSARLLEQVGVDEFLTRLRDLGLEVPLPADTYGLGLALGSAESSLEELARAYVTLSQAGTKSDLHYTRGNEEMPTTTQIGVASTWELTGKLLSDPFLRSHSFGTDSILKLPFETAVKTGTSSSYRDNWVIGFSSEYTVAVWVGNFSGEPMANISGVTGAGPMFAALMMRLHPPSHRPAPLPAPASYSRVPVCPLSGHRPGHHCPESVLEYVETSRLPAYEERPCPFHAHGGILTLPPVFHRWAESKGLKVNSNPSFAVLSPIHGAVYTLDPDVPLEKQRLSFATTITDTAVEWSVDGESLPAADSALWTIRAGEHTVTARTATGRKASVSFRVQEPESLFLQAGPGWRPQK